MPRRVIHPQVDGWQRHGATTEKKAEINRLKAAIKRPREDVEIPPPCEGGARMLMEPGRVLTRTLAGLPALVRDLDVGEKPVDLDGDLWPVGRGL